MNARLREANGRLRVLRVARLERPSRGVAGRSRSRASRPGAYLAWNDNPDKTVPHFPQVPCACGKDFPGPTTWACGTADVLRFLSDIAIPATINQAERHARAHENPAGD